MKASIIRPSSASFRPVAVRPAAAPASPGTILGIIVVVVAALHFGRDILVPLALAVLLSFALNPLASRFRRWGLGRIPSVLLAVLLACTVLLAFGTVVATQVTDLANGLPRYERNIREKIGMLGGEGGVVQEASKVFEDIRRQMETAPGAPDGGGPQLPGRQEEDAVLVEVKERAPSPIDIVGSLAGPVLAPAAVAGMMLVFVVFMLLQREDLRDRLIRLAGTRDLSRTTEALNDAARRVSRYLLMQVVINVSYGVMIGLGLYAVGVPNPMLWGLLAAVLRFVPFLGPIIAAAFPIALSFAVAPGWMLPVMTVGLFVLVELFSNNVMEPWLYGSSTGLSPLAIIVAAVFWTTLWGPAGLLLSTPLTVCLLVLGRHVPQLAFLEVLFGDRPVLPPEAKMYQRLLARDVFEAAEIARTALKETTIGGLYDDVVLPALQLAEHDRQRGSLNREAREHIRDGLERLLEELEDEGVEEAPATASASGGTVLCLGTRNQLDDASALLVVDLLERRDVKAEALPRDFLGLRRLAELDRGAAAVCLACLSPAAPSHAGRLVRRVRAHFGEGVPIVLCLWRGRPGEERGVAPPGEVTGATVATSFAEVLAALEQAGIIPATYDAGVGMSDGNHPAAGGAPAAPDRLATG